MLRRIRLLGRLGPGGQHLAELSLSRDTADQHLLVYGTSIPTGWRR